MKTLQERLVIETQARDEALERRERLRVEMEALRPRLGMTGV